MATSGGSSGFTNPMTTAGDLIDGGASGAPQRLAVGSNGQVLSVVTGAPAWAAASGGAVALISSQVLGSAAASVTFSAIPATYNHLRLVVIAASSKTTADYFIVQFNADTGNHYDGLDIYNNYGTVVPGGQHQVAQASTLPAANDLPGTNATAGVGGHLDLFVYSYAGTTFYKTGVLTSGYIDGAATVMASNINDVIWRSTAAITSVLVAPGSGDNFVTGSSFYLYGIT